MIKLGITRLMQSVFIHIQLYARKETARIQPAPLIPHGGVGETKQKKVTYHGKLWRLSPYAT